MWDEVVVERLVMERWMVMSRLVVLFARMSLLVCGARIPTAPGAGMRALFTDVGGDEGGSG